MNRRDAILSGAQAASETLEGLEIRQAIEKGLRGSVDVFRSILNKDAVLVFRPLDGLLGAYLPGPGVMITTNRTLPVQRFTGAHELGHVVMDHSPSIDGEEILQFDGASDIAQSEVEANSFATEFLAPRWLLAFHARKQSWKKESMYDPGVVYQLSLRLGLSYDATTRALERHQIIDGAQRQRLLGISPKTIKQNLLHGYTPDNWHRDVWLITNRDEGLYIEGQPGDLFRFQLNEKSGAGYLWDFETLKSHGFIVESDERSSLSHTDNVGGPLIREVTAHSPSHLRGNLRLRQKRPWQSDSPGAEEVSVQYNLFGKEKGLPRAQRPQSALA